MAGETLSPWLDIDEEARRRFEAAWARGTPETIEAVLPQPGDPRRLATLEELVCIELELTWRARPPGLRVEDYLGRFPELDSPEVAARLRQEEAGVLARFGSAGYRREEAVGRGGMGVVWKAADPVLGRDVALKELREFARRHPELRRRFLAEARVTAQLEHPGVVPVYELVEDVDAPYYTMKLVHGQTLVEALHQATTPLERRRLHEAFLTVVRTVAFAHARGVVHRDLKPDNILLGAYGETVVLDWGLARARPAAGVATPDDPVTTQPGTVLGTPVYMSPEAAEGEPADPRSDQYALGAVLYEILTQRRPYEGPTTEAILDAVRTGPPPSPRALVPTVPPELDAICTRAMARDPGARYPDVSAMAVDLERYLADEPTEAWPEPWSRRAGRWARRNRTLVAAATAAVIVASAAGVVGLVAKERADQLEARRVAALQQSVASAEDQARTDLDAGRYREARDRLDAALSVVHDEPWHRVEAESLRERAADLAAFVEQADDADRLAFLGFEVAAAARSEQALAQLGVFDHADWWFELPDELPPERVDELQWAVWHQLNLLAGLVAADDCTSGRAVARHAGHFRPSPVLERALDCAPRDPCVSDGSGTYWVGLEEARCLGASPARVEEGLGYALRARAQLGDVAGRHEAFSDLQAALDREAEVAEVHWLAALGLAEVETLGGNEAAREFHEAIELEMAESRPRSPSAHERLLERLQRAEAHAHRPLPAGDRQWLEPDALALQRLVREALDFEFPRTAPVPPPTGRPVDEAPRRLAVLNGGFELGLARHWGRGMYQHERPIWWTSLTARSEAEVVEDEVHSGRRALRIRHESINEPHVFATTTQAVPAEAGATYRLTVWARQPVPAVDGGVVFPMDAGWHVTALSIGASEGWMRYQGEFVAAEDTVHLRLLANARVEVWIDDIAIERVDAVREANAGKL